MLRGRARRGVAPATALALAGLLAGVMWIGSAPPSAKASPPTCVPNEGIDLGRQLTAVDDVIDPEHDPGDYTDPMTRSISIPAATVSDNDYDNLTDDGGIPLAAPAIAAGRLTAHIHKVPRHAASFQFNTDGSFTYRPVADYWGGDSFEYFWFWDGLCSNAATVTIQPFFKGRLHNDEITVYRDETYDPIPICGYPGLCGILANDENLSRDNHGLVWFADAGLRGQFLVGYPEQTDHGTLTMRLDGTFTYTPNPGFQGTDHFYYGVAVPDSVPGPRLRSYGPYKFLAAVVTITVVPKPVTAAASDFIASPEDTHLLPISPSTLLANDTNAFEVFGVAGYPDLVNTRPATARTQHGTLTITWHELGPFTGVFWVTGLQYTPDKDYSGPDWFPYTAEDSAPGSHVSDSWVSIDVANVADPPAPDFDDGVTKFGSPLTVKILANDRDPDGDLDPSTVALKDNPYADGRFVLNADHTLTLTPPAGIWGVMGLHYTVKDLTGLSGLATVQLFVSPLRDDAYSLDEDTILTASGLGVRANDAPPTSSVNVVVATPPTHGDLQLDPSGTFKYTPDADYAGPDSFTYKLTSGYDGNSWTTMTATASIYVYPVADAPTVTLAPACAVDSLQPGEECSPDEDIRDVFAETPVRLRGYVYDPDPYASGSLVVDWGDGTPPQYVSYPCLPPEFGGQCGAPAWFLPTWDACPDSCPGRLYVDLEHDYVANGYGTPDFYRITVHAVESGSPGPSVETAARVTFSSESNPPTVTAPVTSVRSGGQISGSTIPVRATWSGSDSGSGIHHYKFRRRLDNGSFVPMADAVTPSADTAMTAGTTYTFQSQAFDLDTNASVPATGVRLRAGVLQTSNPSVTHSASWTTVTGSSLSGGSALSATTTGASASFSFTGRSVGLATSTGPTNGAYRVFVDGHLSATVDTLAASPKNRVVTWSRTWATTGTHTIKIVVVGSIGRPTVVFDAIAGIYNDLTAPTVTAPAVVIHAGVSLSGSAIPITLSWTGADDASGSGIDHYELAKTTDGTTWTTVSSTLTTPTRDTTVGSSTTRFRARAIDLAGNASPWLESEDVTAGLVQNSDPSWTRTGTWKASSSSSYSGGSVRWATTAGASASYTLIAQSLAVVSTLAPSHGEVKIYVDGSLKATVDTTAASTTYRAVIWQRTYASIGQHTIKLVVVGTAGRPRFDLDALAVF